MPRATSGCARPAGSTGSAMMRRDLLREPGELLQVVRQATVAEAEVQHGGAEGAVAADHLVERHPLRRQRRVEQPVGRERELERLAPLAPATRPREQRL